MSRDSRHHKLRVTMSTLGRKYALCLMHTEYDSLSATIVRRCNCSKPFLTSSILRNNFRFMNRDGIRRMTYPNTQFDLLSLHLHFMNLVDVNVITNFPSDNLEVKRTRKSTPMVALLSSSGSHCSSENRSNRLDFPTEELPMRSNLTFMGCDAGAVGGMLKEMNE